MILIKSLFSKYAKVTTLLDLAVNKAGFPEKKGYYPMQLPLVIFAITRY